jgi:DNA-binding transcriptional regulator YhcF (GntR family)
MEKSQPVCRMAIRFVKEGIHRGDFHAGDQLPGIRALAIQAGVSMRTMWKALGFLRKAGVVRGTPRRRMTVVNPAAKVIAGAGKPSSDHACGASWQRLRSELERKIIAGAFAPGKALPGIKQLCGEYDVDSRTLKKSLVSLAADGLLVPHGRGFAVSGGSRSSARMRVVLLVNGGGTPAFTTGHLDSDYVRRLEAACAMAGIGLELSVFFTDADNRLAIVDQTTGKERMPGSSEDIAGYVYLMYSRDCLSEELLGRLRHTGKPVAIVDGIGQGARLRDVADIPRMKVFEIALAAAPSRGVAHALISRGHRHVGYFAPTHRAEWSQRRLEGIVAAFARAGFPEAVTRFTLDRYEQVTDFAESARKRCDISSLVKSHLGGYRAWRRHAPRAYTQRLDPMFEQPLLYGMYLEAELCAQMQELFARALADASITAWIMSHDYPAIMALRFLRDAGIAVPEKLSVISFGDYFDALKHRLTSYNFNIEGMVQAIMRFLLHPDDRGMYARKQRVEIEGFLVHRSTVGPAGS